MITSEKDFPTTREELMAECRELVSHYDLYELGEPGEFDGRITGGCCPEGGEWIYGVAMIPAQWVLHVLGDVR